MSTQHMQFRFVQCASLPPLAWCLEIEERSDLARVIHGASVEADGDRFFEGAWAGDFSRSRFDTRFMTGTGGLLCSEGIKLVTPSHTLDRLNVLHKGSTLFVSNSLPFVLELADERLDPDFLWYDSYVASIKYGVRKFQREIPTRAGRSVRFYYFCNLLVGAGRAPRVITKPASPPFSSYDDYRKYLDETVSRIARNAADPRRRTRYEPLATISRGYDSPAAMVIAMGVGCSQAVTFRQSRGTEGDEDCGTVIAKRLGVRTCEFGRLDYKKHPEFPEIENSGGPNEFLSFGQSLTGKLLFTGFHGDKVWDKNCDKVSSDLVRGDASGSSLTELRLRVGFLHLPVPFIAADSHPSLHAIANSKDMAPWCTGNRYDRPIARRIVEDAGVPRDMFGQTKRAAGVVVSAEGLAATLSDKSLADFGTFAETNWSIAKSLQTALVRAADFLVRGNWIAARILNALGRRLGLPALRPPALVPHKLEMLSYGYVGRESLLFHWGVGKLTARYRAALNSANRDEEYARTKVAP